MVDFREKKYDRPFIKEMIEKLFWFIHVYHNIRKFRKKLSRRSWWKELETWPEIGKIRHDQVNRISLVPLYYLSL